MARNMAATDRCVPILMNLTEASEAATSMRLKRVSPREQMNGRFSSKYHGRLWAERRNPILVFRSDEPDRGVRGSNVDAFEASVTKETNEWTVFLQIPWTTLGGTPQSHFGLPI